MDDPEILLAGSAREWFREAIAGALSQRRLAIQAPTEIYLSDLLTRFLERDRLFVADGEGPSRAEPLALLLLKALQEADRVARSRELRRLGDTALFVSGFFGDSLARSLVGVDYYIAMGERAYGTLAGTERARGQGDLYGELSERFALFVDLFAEIAELSSLNSNRGIVRLYERFLLSRSERVAAPLRARGVALFSGPPRPPPGGYRH